MNSPYQLLPGPSPNFSGIDSIQGSARVSRAVFGVAPNTV